MRGSLLGGRYRIQNKIGEGGMAYVYVALDEKLQRKVAIKILHRHMADNADIRKRFFQEAQAISALDHPNILKIYDFSGENSEDLWIVTEILQGVNLNEFTNSFPGKWLHPIIAVIMTREILKALDKAHHEGLVHRDVKPENIMVLNVGKIKLMDFGIAKNTRGNSITLTGTFMGSPSYMSPEQIRGKSVDQRSDLYSLGVLLYEIVTGRLPFIGNTTHDVILKICEGKYKEPRNIVPNLPDDLNRIIVKSMEKYPSNRYQEARSFSRDLDIFLSKHGFEESNIELERYASDREKFELRLRALDFTNKATVTAAIASTNMEPNRSAEKTKTQQKTRVLSQEEQLQFKLQQQNASAIEQPKTSAQITWMPQQALKQASASSQRKDHHVPPQFSAPSLTKRSRITKHQHTVMPEHFRHTPHNYALAQQPGRLRKRRVRPRTPRRAPSTQVVYRVAVPSRSDFMGLLAGVIFIGVILLASVLGFLHLRKASTVVSTNTTPLRQDSQRPAAKTPAPVAVAPKKTDEAAQKADKTPLKKEQSKTPKATAERKPVPAVSTNTSVLEALAPKARPNQAPAKDKADATSDDEAYLRISSQPAAEIFIDNRRVGTTIDKTINSGWLAFPAGQAVVELRRAGYQSVKKTITGKKGARLDLGNTQLKSASTYELILTSEKPGVRVTITNLSDRAQRSFALNGQSQTQSLAAGRYKVRFDYNGQTIERNIALTGNDFRRNLSVNFD